MARTFLLFACASACVLAMPSGALAAPLPCTTTFTGAVDATWSTAGNWSAGTPDSTDTACVDVATSTPTIDTDIAVDALSVRNGTLTIPAPRMVATDQLELEDATLAFDGGALTSSTGLALASVPGSALVAERVELLGGAAATVTAGSISSDGVDLTLTLCDITDATDITSNANVDVTDLDCIDPAPTHVRSLTLTGSGALRMLGAGGTLDNGGTLELTGRLELASGATLTDDVTVVSVPTDVELGMTGTGDATIEQLFAGAPPAGGAAITASVSSGQALTLRHHDASETSCIDQVTTSGGGSVAFRDTTQRAIGCVALDDASGGSTPARYFLIGASAPYEPVRGDVVMHGAGWTTGAGGGRAGAVSGSGTITGSLTAESVTARGGTLRIIGAADIDMPGVSHGVGTDGVLDLRDATSQTLGTSFYLEDPTVATPVAQGDVRVVAPGIQKAPASIVADPQLEIPAGTAWRIAVDTGLLRVADSVAPGAATGVTSTSHASPTYTKTMTATWGAAPQTGNSPIVAYEVSFSRDATTPGATKLRTSTLSATSGTLYPAQWWIHVSAIDADGDVGPLAHGGPFTVTELLVPPTLGQGAMAAISWATTAGATPKPIVKATFPALPVGTFDAWRVERRDTNALGRIGAWSPLLRIDTPGARSAVVRLVPGRATCVRQVLVNASGETPSVERCTRAPLDDVNLARSASFRLVRVRGSYRGTVVLARRARATLSTRIHAGATLLTVKARTCASCGVLDVTVSGKRVGSISLVSRRTIASTRRVLKLPRHAANAPLVLRTRSAAPVQVDAIAVT